jgi:hypothetical protein
MIAAVSDSQTRASASKVAKWFLDKGRPDDAVHLLAALAASGPNDAEGQNLLAEAFRIDPSASVAKLAFERMEGIVGDQSTLDAAIARWTREEIAKAEAEMRKPSFRRAQLGHNNNVKYKGLEYHIQTEDSGLDKPHVITHLFADGGRVIKSHKRSYAEHVAREDVAPYVRQLMKGQQMEMAIMLREARFDAIIAGKAVGGMEVLEGEPRAQVQRLATKREEKVEVAKDASVPALVQAPVSRPDSVVRFRLHGERFCHPREAAISWRDGSLWLEDYEAGNGVFLRVKSAVELGIGDEFIVGDQLLRVERNPTPNDGPDPGPTYFYSSPQWISSFRVVQIFEKGARGACVVAHGTSLQIGSAVGDLVFGNDSLVSEQHCVVEEQAGVIVLSDLASRTGVFVRIKGVQELVHGDELLVGRTRLAVDLSKT